VKDFNGTKHIESHRVRSGMLEQKCGNSGTARDTVPSEGAQTWTRLSSDEANAKVSARGDRPATGEPIPGLVSTKASLQTRSFISAASFQETTRVLTKLRVQASGTKLL